MSPTPPSSLSIGRPAVAVLALVALAAGGSCARKGLIAQTYSPSYYRVGSVPPSGPHAKNPVFLVYGDTQSGWRINQKFFRRENWWTRKALVFPFYYLYNFGHAVVGGVNYLRSSPDYGGKERRFVRDAVFNRVLDERPDFVLNLGDICMDDGRRPRHWETFLRENRLDVPLLDAVAYLPVIGNHEHANDTTYGYPNYRAVFDYPRFYVLDYPDVAVFVVDSNIIVDQYGDIDDAVQDDLFDEWFVSPPGSADRAWLERELAKRSQAFKIIAMHHPPVSVGRHFSDWTNGAYGPDLRGKRARLLGLFADGGVSLVLSGHEHFYEHSVARRAGDPALPRGGVHMLITSGGGAPIRPILSDEEIRGCRRACLKDGFQVDLVAHHQTHHFTRISVDHDSLVVETFEAEPDAKKGSNAIDRFAITGR